MIYFVSYFLLFAVLLYYVYNRIINIDEWVMKDFGDSDNENQTLIEKLIISQLKELKVYSIISFIFILIFTIITLVLILNVYFVESYFLLEFIGKKNQIILTIINLPLIILSFKIFIFCNRLKRSYMEKLK